MTPKAPWPYARVAAHRGGGTMAPENTLAAFREGLRYGYRAVETDAMLSSDKIPVLMHDEEFGRTILDDKRSIPELTFSEIRMLDAGRWYGPRYTGEPPAAFEPTVRFCRANNVWMNIEIKPAGGHELETGRVVGEMTKALYADVIRPEGYKQENVNPACPLFSSFKADALRGAMETALDIPRGFLVDEMPENWREILAELKCVSFHTNWKRTTPELVKEVKDLGYWMLCWTVNDPKVVRELFSWGVDAVCTDRLDCISPIW